MEINLKNENATTEFGNYLGKLIQKIEEPSIEIHLKGNLGSGKTYLVKKVINCLGWKGNVTSPTYNICKEYNLERFLCLHVDLYRISSPEDIHLLDLDRMINKSKIVFVEWPEKLKGTRDPNILIEINYKGVGRLLRLSSSFEDIKKKIKKKYA